MSAGPSGESRSAYRAQVQGVSGWVDGALWVRREDAEDECTRLAARYQAAVRVVEVAPLDAPASPQGELWSSEAGWPGGPRG